MFSGGTLTAGGNKDGDNSCILFCIKDNLPHVSLFGGAWGNAILQGKMKVNGLIPIAKETAHIIPENFLPDDVETLPSVYTYLQLEMFTRRENSKDAPFEKYIESSLDVVETSQMIYHVETIQAGTPFYMKVVLEDVTDIEFAAFLSALANFNTMPVVGGKGAVGLGQIEMHSLEWSEVSKIGNHVNIDRNLTTANLYERFLKENQQQVKTVLRDLG
ncbi:hypothetical protein C7N43_38290 [Sphingobacteriales bacterium UPWRP_1]|nr:hypothetical protein C7N43_38290 [Sphingobacteriales bacterium UPWRP_1]